MTVPAQVLHASGPTDEGLGQGGEAQETLRNSHLVEGAKEASERRSFALGRPLLPLTRGNSPVTFNPMHFAPSPQRLIMLGLWPVSVWQSRLLYTAVTGRDHWSPIMPDAR